MQSNVKEGVLFRSPRDEAERAGVANACVRKLGIHFPALLDGFDNRVETAYTGWPDRLYLVAQGGRVLYKSRPGPFGFHPNDLAQAIQRRPSGRNRRPQRPGKGYPLCRLWAQVSSFFEVAGGVGAKYFQPLDLAADISKQSTYGQIDQFASGKRPLFDRASHSG